jgi:hypothetical protein
VALEPTKVSPKLITWPRPKPLRLTRTFKSDETAAEGHQNRKVLLFRTILPKVGLETLM